METQRTLLAELAHFFIPSTDPQERLDTLRRDQADAETEIRAVLDRLAEKYNVLSSDVDDAMTSVGLAIGDMTIEAENEYLEGLDLTEPA